MIQGSEQWLRPERYGCLTLICEADQKSKDGRKQSKWMCDCGNEKVLPTGRVRGGYVSSCGCLTRIMSTKIHTKHGKRESRAYSIWSTMKGRCQNPRDKDFHKYGGRGITICARWQEFAGFYEDMGDPGEHMSIDRIDNNLGYFKENCRWATGSQQQRNKSNSCIWSIKRREFLTLKDAADNYGVSIQTIHKWVHGWYDARRNMFNKPREDCHAKRKYEATE